MKVVIHVLVIVPQREVCVPILDQEEMCNPPNQRRRYNLMWHHALAVRETHVV